MASRAIYRRLPSGEAAGAFNGKSGPAANGTWKLRIQDSFAGDTGTLQCWSLNINQGPAPGVVNDFNGNGGSDLAVFRPSTGTWFINGVGSGPFGLTGDIPVSGDYNGDGVTDAAVYRPSTGQWFIGGGRLPPSSGGGPATCRYRRTTTVTGRPTPPCFAPPTATSACGC